MTPRDAVSASDERSMDQERFFTALLRVAGVIARHLGELVHLKEEELTDSDGGSWWYLTSEGEQWVKDQKGALPPIPRQYLTKEQPTPESLARKLRTRQCKR